MSNNSIVGLAFVATGPLEHFGFYDEYTGAHDLSDLKVFIEDCGGFLRSAVSGKTDYLICNDTAFVFVRDDYAIPAVPPWAIKLILEPNDI